MCLRRGKRIVSEKLTVKAMIQIFCNHHHGTAKGSICEKCFSLYLYAIDRLDRCPYGENKGTCKKCNIHCYNLPMRNEIKEVMRYAGPRMLYHHPLMTLRHLYRELI